MGCPCGRPWHPDRCITWMDGGRVASAAGRSSGRLGWCRPSLSAVSGRPVSSGIGDKPAGEFFSAVPLAEQRRNERSRAVPPQRWGGATRRASTFGWWNCRMVAGRRASLLGASRAPAPSPIRLRPIGSNARGRLLVSRSGRGRAGSRRDEPLGVMRGEVGRLGTRRGLPLHSGARGSDLGCNRDQAALVTAHRVTVTFRAMRRPPSGGHRIVDAHTSDTERLFGASRCPDAGPGRRPSGRGRGRLPAGQVRTWLAAPNADRSRSAPSALGLGDAERAHPRREARMSGGFLVARASARPTGCRETLSRPPKATSRALTQTERAPEAALVPS